MSPPKRPRRGEEGVIFLETEGRDDVARALAEAERAIEAVEDKHRRRQAAQPVAVAVHEPERDPAPAVELEDPLGDVVEEVAVVGDRDHGA